MMNTCETPSDWAQSVDFTGNLDADVRSFLQCYGKHETYLHCVEVERQARILAHRFGLDAELVSQAAMLHDISAVIPVERRAIVAKAWGLEVLPEEELFPLVVHQKLSAIFASQVFGISCESVLRAIECHTTLKADPTRMDMLLFVADKICWDQSGTPPYLSALVTALDHTLEEAAYTYLDYMWNRRSELAVVHPWLVEAYTALGEGLGDECSCR